MTVIRGPDGRYYASFVVEVADTPLPQTANDVGIDLGLTSLAVLSTGEVVQNPRYLRRKARALARAQKSLARKTKGSNRGAKVVRRVAVQHRRVRRYPGGDGRPVDPSTIDGPTVDHLGSNASLFAGSGRSSSWLGGAGIAVHSNGDDMGTAYSCAGLSTSNPSAQNGYGWQCVEPCPFLVA